MNEPTTKVEISDPSNAAGDPNLPTVASALDPQFVNDAFRHSLTRIAGEGGRVSVRSIDVIRHKPGRRCVIEYGVRVKYAGAPWGHATLIGKIRARRYGSEGLRLQESIWNSGFQADSTDGISVPEPVAAIPSLQMWLQRKVGGAVSSGPLAGQHGPDLARHIATGIYKLHRANIPTDRRHGMGDELRILHECLPRAVELRPELTARIDRVLAAARRLAATVPEPQPCGIHRDFYPAQVIADGERIWLLDFDLYCLGDPALDAGNFVGHLAEASLRTHGAVDTSDGTIRAFVDRFVELSGEETLPAIEAYTTLTLVRHIYLSTQFSDRAAFTERLLAVCETRLARHL